MPANFMPEPIVQLAHWNRKDCPAPQFAFDDRVNLRLSLGRNRPMALPSYDADGLPTGLGHYAARPAITSAPQKPPSIDEYIRRRCKCKATFLNRSLIRFDLGAPGTKQPVKLFKHEGDQLPERISVIDADELLGGLRRYSGPTIMLPTLKTSASVPLAAGALVHSGYRRYCGISRPRRLRLAH